MVERGGGWGARGRAPLRPLQSWLSDFLAHARKLRRGANSMHRSEPAERAVYRPPMRRHIEAAAPSATRSQQAALDAERAANRARKLAALQGYAQDEPWDDGRPRGDESAPAVSTSVSPGPDARAAIQRAPPEAVPASEPDDKVLHARDAAEAADPAQEEARTALRARSAASPSSRREVAEQHEASRHPPPPRVARPTYMPPGRRAAMDREARVAEAAASRAASEAAAREEARRAAIEEARRQGAERRARAAAEEEAAAAQRRAAAAELRLAVQAQADARVAAAEAEAAAARAAAFEQARREGAERRAVRREAEDSKRALALVRARRAVEQGRCALTRLFLATARDPLHCHAPVCVRLP